MKNLNLLFLFIAMFTITGFFSANVAHAQTSVDPLENILASI